MAQRRRGCLQASTRAARGQLPTNNYKLIPAVYPFHLCPQMSWVLLIIGFFTAAALAGGGWFAYRSLRTPPPPPPPRPPSPPPRP
jgi:hypothetical protein